MVDMTRTDIAMVAHRDRIDRANARGWMVQAAHQSSTRMPVTRRVAVARLAGLSGGVAAAAGLLGVVVGAVLR